MCAWERERELTMALGVYVCIKGGADDAARRNRSMNRSKSNKKSVSRFTAGLKTRKQKLAAQSLPFTLPLPLAMIALDIYV